MFVEVAGPLLDGLPAADGALERARLFGSAITVGIIDTMLGLEASRPSPIRERWLEYRLEGEFALGGEGRRVALKGIADRVDLLDGDRLRVIDYKSGSAPRPSRALQVPVYALCAAERLGERDGRPWTVEEASYVAFSGKRALVPVVRPGRAAAAVLDAARARTMRVIDGIAGGEFRRVRTTRSSAPGARTPRSAGRTTSAVSDPRLPFGDAADDLASRRDGEGRARAVDPRFNVALEASAGTGKTQILVDRYVNLMDHGVDPANVLAMTFTRKATAEMRARIVAMLHARAERGEISPARWRHLRDRLGDVAISTIDAFCLSLLREFPLEADLDPGFSMADETEVPRLIDESLDRALQICRNLARDDEDVALVFAHLGERRVGQGLATLLSRRIVAPRVLARYLETAPPGLDAPAVTRRAARGLVELFAALPGGLDAFLETGPPVPSFLLLTRDLQRLRHGTDGDGNPDPAAVQAALARAADHLLTQAGKPRKALGQPRTVFVSESEWRSHRELVLTAGPALAALLAAHRRDLNMLAARGLRRMFAVATTEYRRTLDAHAALDFPRCCCGRSPSCARWRSSRRAATGSSRVTNTCSWTSSRIRAAHNGSWSRSWSGRGARAPG